MRWGLVLGSLVGLTILVGCAGDAPPDATVATQETLAPDSGSPDSGTGLSAGTHVRDSTATRPVPLSRTAPRPPSARPVPAAESPVEPTPRMKGEATPEPAETTTPDEAAETPPATRALGIVEVDTGVSVDEAPAVIEGLTRVRYAAGEDVPWNPGLFLLDIRTGAVEGWVLPLDGSADAELGAAATDPGALQVSPGNRFVLWTGGAGQPVLYDRQTGGAHTWDPALTRFDRWLNSGDGERLLFQVVGTDTYELVDASMQTLWRLELPQGARFTSPSGRYLLVQGCVGCEPGDRYHHLNISDDPDPVVHTWTLPWSTAEREPSDEVTYQIELLDDLVTIVADTGEGSCRAARYDLDGWLRSDEAVACQRLWRGPPAGISVDRIPPDEGLLSAATTGLLDDPEDGTAVSFLTMYNGSTGLKIVRVTTVGQYAADGQVLKLADSSALVLGSAAGLRFATINGAWRRAPVGADGFGAPDDLVVTNLRGAGAMSLRFGAPAAAIPVPEGGGAFMDAFADWGRAHDTLRVRTTVSYLEPVSPGP